MKKILDIKGMTCSACTAHVEKVVLKLKGINSVSVNLLSNNMKVDFDEHKITANDICEAVTKAGYKTTQKDNKQVKKEKVDSSMNSRVIISIIFLLPIMYIAMGSMLSFPLPNILKSEKNILINVLTQFFLLLPIIYVNRSYFINGLKNLVKRNPNMDSLIAIGASASIIYGIIIIYVIAYATSNNQIHLLHQYSHEIYFESAATILTLITIGKFLETKSKNKTTDAIKKLVDLTPKKALRIKNGIEEEIDSKEIQVQDILIIKPGAKLPVDGVVIEGNSYVDESAITGESMPKHKKIGDEIISASINTTGILKIRATKVGEDTTIAQIIQLVYEASNSKAPISKLADKVSGIFVPTIMAISALTFIYWLLIANQPISFSTSLAIAVLVISCPCALGLATPVAIMVGIGEGALRGILIKSGETLEIAHSVDTVVLDKTGTITEGKPKVVDIVLNEKEEYTNERLLEIAYNIERFSEHPLSNAIKEYVKDMDIRNVEVTNYEAIAGKGIRGEINHKQILAGSKRLLEENGITVNKIVTNKDRTLIYISEEKKLIGVIAVADTIIETSKKAVELIKNMKIKVMMLTGDNQISAQSIAKEVGIESVIAEVLPQEKEEVISKLQKQGKKVLMVGDGINDAPALARANVGIAIGRGTDIAIDSADMVVIKSDLTDVANAIKLSKAVILNIKQNLFWAFTYNIILIPVAAGILYNSFGIKLNPMFGAAAMSLSSVCVITNALRLRNIKLNTSKNNIKERKEEKIVKKVIKIEGMMCNHCVSHVTDALNTLDVTDVIVNLESNTATIEMKEEIADEILQNTIKEAGYTVISIEII